MFVQCDDLEARECKKCHSRDFEKHVEKNVTTITCKNCGHSTQITTVTTSTQPSDGDLMYVNLPTLEF